MAVFKVAKHDKDPYRETYMADKIHYILNPEKVISGQWDGDRALVQISGPSRRFPASPGRDCPPRPHSQGYPSSRCCPRQSRCYHQW